MLVLQDAQNTEEDWKRFYGLEEEFYDHYADKGIGKQYGRMHFSEVPVHIIREEFDRYLSGNDEKEHYFKFAFDEDICVGYINGWIKEKSGWYRMREIAHLESLIVASAHRGKGFSTIMVEDFFAWARTKGVSICQLEVWAKNVDAVDIYRKWGFETDELILWKQIA